MRRIYLVASIVLFLDLVTKWIVTQSLPVHGISVRVLGDLLRWTYVQNQGSAFGLFQGGRFFFIGFSLVSLALILMLARSPRYRVRGYAIALGMILGGALGNLVDRILYGAVTDWIDVGLGRHRWPTFNVADIGVTLGVLILAGKMLAGPSYDSASDPPAKPAGAGPASEPHERGDAMQIGTPGEGTGPA
ncbi:MAG: signal peptidase II [Candidatus Eisenbacteria bacterium]|nr:signal peptidase II [Candidatus Eisenbacteria bacterium]